jgi:NADPH-dependent glutamate synthase beta subunit-like oxidoreductase
MPVPIGGSEADLPFDTVIAAISEKPGTSCLMGAKSHSLVTTPGGTLRTEPATLMTARAGVFAGGDVVTGPNTVIDAIAAGKKAAVMIRRYLEGEQLDQPGVIRLPETYVEPALLSEDELETADRVEIPELDAASRHHNYREVDLSLSAGDATREARRCLRCDLEFTRPKVERTPRPAVAGGN